MRGIILKKIRVKKDNLKYFFTGGMVYNEKFSFDTGSKIHYPFTTYYVSRITDKKENGIKYKSLIYCKLPLICLQFEDYCKCIEFDLPAKCGDNDIIPFIGLNETQNYYEIIFKYFPEMVVKEKKNAWLGFAKKRRANLPTGKIKFKVMEYKKKSWLDAVRDFFKKQNIKRQIIKTKELMLEVKEALFRSYDHETGTFLQMPWTNFTGFCLDGCSYSLMGFEAKRLNYFQELYEKTGDPDYKNWVEKLEKLFLNSNLYTKTKNGFVWYNMTYYNGRKLKGLFYLDVGYAGYPPGQATISLNLGEYLQRKKNKRLEALLKKNLDYIIKTQNKDGSWPAAISYKFKKKNWEKSEGSTAECVRALLKGYHIFKDKKFIEVAKKALRYLEKENIICKNVLRDTGIDEPESFSAIITVNAFLDAYEVFGDKKYLHYAKNYAYYMLTWFYWYGNLKGYFHPISESITPRISPFESMMVVSTYKRLYKKTKDKVWNEVSDYLFNRVLEVKDRNNALSEGIFPKLNGNLYYLPMEQTFATAELLHTCLLYTSYKYKRPRKEKIKIEEKEDCYILEDSIRIKKNIFSLSVGNRKIDFLISQPYNIRSWFRTKISVLLRKSLILSSIRYAKYPFTGIGPPKIKKICTNSFEKYITNYYLKKGEDEITATADLPYHKIEARIFKSGKIKMELAIYIKEHDLVCNKVIINDVDYTLDTNWTNGGLFKKVIDL